MADQIRSSSCGTGQTFCSKLWPLYPRLSWAWDFYKVFFARKLVTIYSSFFLEGRDRIGEGEGEGGKDFSIFWFIPQMPTTARAQPAQSKERVITPTSPYRMVATQTHGPQSRLSEPALTGAGAKAGALKHRQSDTGCGPKWNSDC